jgi:hypothetical protein
MFNRTGTIESSPVAEVILSATAIYADAANVEEEQLAQRMSE